MHPLGVDEAEQEEPDLYVVFGLLDGTLASGGALHGGVQRGSAAFLYLLLVMVGTSPSVAANCRGSRSSRWDVEGAGSNCETRPPTPVFGSANRDCFCRVSTEV